MEARHRAPLKGHRPCSSSQERQEHPRLSRRARLRTGALVAASFSVGAGLDHALEEQKRAAITAAHPNPPPWLPLVPDDIPTTEYLVTTLDKLGEQPVPLPRPGSWREAAPGGTFLARQAAHARARCNNDPLPGSSPNEVLCPMGISLFLELSGLAPPGSPAADFWCHPRLSTAAAPQWMCL